MTILNTEAVILSSWGFSSGGIILFSAGILFIFAFAYEIIADDSDISMAALCWLLALALVLCGIGLGICSQATKTEHIQYYMTINDTVSFKEFTDRYNIIEQKGEIYIVEDKEKD